MTDAPSLFAATAEPPSPDLPSRAERGPVLLAIARAAIADAFGRMVAADRSAAWLDERRACFVTLTEDRRLRGCIGSLAPRGALADEVAHNARAAAFDDPRFPPLAAEELDRTRIEVSLLSDLEPLPVRSQAEALRAIRPGVDGLVLEWRGRRGTFLPQVWQQLPDPNDFLLQLRRKAGLPRDLWSEEIRLSRYHVDKWSEPETGPTER